MIYLDNAATTKMAPEVFQAMTPYFMEHFGNPGAVYSHGTEAKKAVAKARESVASLIGAKRDEIYFTSGGTEADNWALCAVAEAYGVKGKHVITTKIEHHAILNTCAYLEGRGCEVTYLNVDEHGMISLEELTRSIRPDTILVSVMTANNEVGTIQPIREIGAIARENGILFHTDAVQAFGQIPLDMRELGVDLLSASAHKLNGPKGVGCLYVREGVSLGAYLHGGAQERSHRAGTENVPGIVGFGAAADRAKNHLSEKVKKEIALRDHFLNKLTSEIPDCKLNGHPDKRLPGNLNITFLDVEAVSLLLRLDSLGVCASAGSACTSGSAKPSHVLTAMGLADSDARSTIRLTLSDENTMEEIDKAADLIRDSVMLLRKKKLEVMA